MSQLIMKVKLFATIVAGVVAFGAQAETYTWNGSTETAVMWTDSANWLVDGQPTDSYPASSTDTAVFAEGSVAVFDLALDNAAGGGVKMTVGAGANVTVKSTAETLPTFNCYPVVAANATLTFAHVKKTGYMKSSADTSCIRFVNGADYSPAWICVADQVSRGLWWFEDATFDFSDQMPIGWGVNGCHHDMVLVNTTAGSSLKGKNLSYQYSCTGYLYITNSVLRMRNDAGGNITMGDWTSGGRGVVISGDESLVAPYVMTLGKNATLEFEYGRTDRAAIQVGAGGFTADAASQLILDVPNAPDANKEVPLVSCTGTLTIPEKWLAMDSSCVTADEYVKRLFVKEEGGVTCLMMTLQAPVTDPEPVGRLVLDEGVAGARAKKMKVYLDNRGAGGTKTSITVALYSDSDRTQLVASQTVATERADDTYDVDVTFDDLAIGATYYVRVALSNDVPAESNLDDVFTFAYPEPTATLTWTGWGGDDKWTTPANWGVCAGYPSNATQTAVLPANGTFAYDVTTDLQGVSGIKLNVSEGTTLTLSNSSDALVTFTCTPTLSANATMIFDHVKLDGMANSLSTSAAYRFVNGAEYALGWFYANVRACGLWYFEDSSFVCTDQIPLGTAPSGVSSSPHDVVLVNSTAGGEKAKNLVLSCLLLVTNSVLTMKTGEKITVNGTGKKLEISGDDALVSADGLEVSQSGTLAFDYGNRKRAAIQIGAGGSGFTADDTAKLVVRVPPTLHRNGEVPLVSCAGPMTVPEGWLALNPECVEFPKQLTGLAVKEEGGVKYLMANFTVNKGFAVIVR